MTACDDCIAGCCREFHLLPSGHDVYRIYSSLRVPMGEIVSLRAREGCEAEFRIRLAPHANTHYRMELKKLDERAGDWERRCVFLMTVGGRGRCGIYSVRPVECALYPFAGEPELVTLLPRRPFCPPGSWQSTPSGPTQSALLRQKREERQIFDRVVDDWNAALTAPASEQDFFDHLIGRYASGA